MVHSVGDREGRKRVRKCIDFCAIITFHSNWFTFRLYPQRNVCYYYTYRKTTILFLLNVRHYCAFILAAGVNDFIRSIDKIVCDCTDVDVCILVWGRTAYFEQETIAQIHQSIRSILFSLHPSQRERERKREGAVCCARFYSSRRQWVSTALELQNVYWVQ